ncbi:MAG: hypothetical protein IPL40_01500 [Proteobacteria bacterium]|nr:hypothetical protein [Pseudomonadota bacterium]
MIVTVGPRPGGQLVELLKPTLQGAMVAYAAVLERGGVAETGSPLVSSVRHGPLYSPEAVGPLRVLVLRDRSQPLSGAARPNRAALRTPTVAAMLNLTVEAPLPVERFLRQHLQLDASHPAVAARDTAGMQRVLKALQAQPERYGEIGALNTMGDPSLDRRVLGVALLASFRNALLELVDLGKSGPEPAELLAQTRAGGLSALYRTAFGMRPVREINVAAARSAHASGYGLVPDPRLVKPGAEGELPFTMLMRASGPEFMQMLRDRLRTAGHAFDDGPRSEQGMIPFVRSLTLEELSAVLRGDVAIEDLSAH